VIDIKRNTVQRQIILNALLKLNIHPSIEEIYEEINREHPSISKSTVYRNLRELANAGIIHQVLMPDGLERYDGSRTRHYHFRCVSCGSIFDVDIEYLDGINAAVETKYGFKVHEHDVVFIGLCNNCKNM